MSSILKALKKLEDEDPPKGRSVIWPSAPKRDRTIRRWDIASGWSTVGLWSLIAVVVLVSAGGLFYYLLAPSEREEAMTASVSRTVTKPIHESPSSVTKNQTAPQPPASSSPSPPPLPHEEPSSPAPPPVKTTPEPTAAPAPAVKKVPAAPRKTAPPVRESKAAPDRPATADLPVLTELKLQAISWASVPGDRLAVINGNIMREGTSIEGYAIVRIDRDEVVVRKGSEQWKLVFDLR